MVVVNIVTVTTESGKRLDVLKELGKLAEFAHKNHLGLYTWKVFLSETHPDRFVAFRRFRDDAARAEHLHSKEFKQFVQNFTENLKVVKSIQYSNYTEYDGFGWLYREHEPQMDGSSNHQINGDKCNRKSHTEDTEEDDAVDGEEALIDKGEYDK